MRVVIYKLKHKKTQVCVIIHKNETGLVCASIYISENININALKSIASIKTIKDNQHCITIVYTISK